MTEVAAPPDRFEAVTVHRLVLRQDSSVGFGWAIITLDDTRGAGQLTIASDFGDFVYRWPSSRTRGEGVTFASELRRFGDDYLAGKLGGPDEYDVEATRAAMLDALREAGREARSANRWGRADIAEEFDRIARCGSVDEMLAGAWLDEAWLHIRTCPDRKWAAFWRTFGARFRAALKELP